MSRRMFSKGGNKVRKVGSRTGTMGLRVGSYVLTWHELSTQTISIKCSSQRSKTFRAGTNLYQQGESDESDEHHFKVLGATTADDGHARRVQVACLTGQGARVGTMMATQRRDVVQATEVEEDTTPAVFVGVAQVLKVMKPTKDTDEPDVKVCWFERRGAVYESPVAEQDWVVQDDMPGGAVLANGFQVNTACRGSMLTVAPTISVSKLAQDVWTAVTASGRAVDDQNEIRELP